MAGILDVSGASAGIRRMTAEIRAKASAALYEVGNEVMAESKRLVPVDTGVLKGSGYVDEPRTDRGSVSVEIGYGGPADQYAVYQHENLSLNHPGGGQAKFLEQPLSTLDLPAAIAARMAL